jgi:uncharacterized protein YjbI with pentapeptide repeats
MQRGTEKMAVKIMKPKVPSELPEKHFEDVYDAGEPYIDNALFKDCTISLATDSAVEFTEVKFDNVTFDEAAVSKMYLRDVVFERCDLANAQLSEMTMKRVTFLNCRLVGTSFAESYFEDVVFQDCNLQLAALGFSKQKNVHYASCRLKDADFYENKLAKVAFTDCDLSGINFVGTALKGVDISSSQFDRISVTIEDLKGCIVSQDQALAFLVMLGLVIKGN